MTSIFRSVKPMFSNQTCNYRSTRDRARCPKIATCLYYASNGEYRWRCDEHGERARQLGHRVMPITRT